MRRCVVVLAALLVSTFAPISVGAQEATPASAAANCAAPAAPATSATPSPVASDQTALDAIGQLPLDRLPATVGREEKAEHGVLSLGLPGALAAVKISANVESDTAGP